jgi:hypothetical protein
MAPESNLPRTCPYPLNKMYEIPRDVAINVNDKLRVGFGKFRQVPSCCTDL